MLTTHSREMALKGARACTEGGIPTAAMTRIVDGHPEFAIVPRVQLEAVRAAGLEPVGWVEIPTLEET